ncbi:hypothetical protein, partial [Gilliamella sp. wkB18]|uniref:hypothetical protein n=1 Tax=Gilliamella sp. wkB18 TaxID=3120260 RepID=UPI001C400E88
KAHANTKVKDNIFCLGTFEYLYLFEFKLKIGVSWWNDRNWKKPTYDLLKINKLKIFKNLKNLVEFVGRYNCK